MVNAEGLSKIFRRGSLQITFGRRAASFFLLCRFAARRPKSSAEEEFHPESYRLTWKADEPFGRATGWAGRAEAHTGNGAKALELLTRAERLSPQDPRGWFIPGRLAFVHFMERRYSEAAMSARRALEKNPRSIMSLWLLAASFVKQGQEAEAREVI